MKYKIADLIVEFDPNYSVLEKRAQKYLCHENKENDFKILYDKNTIKKEIEKEETLTAELAEYMLVGAKFYTKLLHFNGCLLHASAVVINNEAYLFSADCGTGKSTHTSLWLKYLEAKNPYILNDDKPAIRIKEDGIYAYGTPFSGKYDKSKNTKVKIKGICFLEQAKVNTIKKITPKEAIPLFLQQTIRKLPKELMIKLLDTMDVILKETPVYQLCCNMSQEAVQLSYETMKGVNTNED